MTIPPMKAGTCHQFSGFWMDEAEYQRESAFTMAMTRRPYPASGGLYELELYPVVARCAGA